MFAKAAFPSTQTLIQTNAFCSKGREESLKSSRHLSSQAWGATLGGDEEHSPPRRAPHPGRGEWTRPRPGNQGSVSGGPTCESTWDSAVPGSGASPSIRVPLGPRNIGLFGKRVFVNMTGLMTLRGDGPELSRGPCTH